MSGDWQLKHFKAHPNAKLLIELLVPTVNSCNRAVGMKTEAEVNNEICASEWLLLHGNDSWGSWVSEYLEPNRHSKLKRDFSETKLKW